MYNAVSFLQHGIYNKVDDTMIQTNKKQQEIGIERHVDHDRKSYYKVIDDPVKVQVAWDRVVAVFVTGQSWQFNKWQWSTPMELFQNVLAVHLAFDDRPPDPQVVAWGVKVVAVNAFKDHVNAAASRQFWQYVDDFMRLHKSHLLLK